MRHTTTTRASAPLGAALAALGLGVAAAGQQSSPARQERGGTPAAQPREMPRQPQAQQGFDPDRIDASRLVGIGMDLDNDGRADVTYLVPGAAAREFAREHRIKQTSGPGGMPLRAEAEMRRSEQGEFEDLPLETGGDVTRTEQLRGTIADTRTARLLGQPQPSALVKVRLPSGAIVFADLGPASSMREQNVRLSRGDAIAISGSPALINDQPVVFADRIRTEQGVIAIQRGEADLPGPSRPEQAQAGLREFRSRFTQEQPTQDRPQPRIERTSTDGPLRLSGTIVEKDSVAIADSEPYQFCKIRAHDGETHWVSLGPRRLLEGLNLDENDQITVLARPVPLRGSTIFYASQLHAGGHTLNVQQEESGPPRLQQAGIGRPAEPLRGTVEEKEEVSIGDSDPYVVVRLRGEDGQTRWVNLGPREQIRDLNISEDDRIEVLARETRLHGQTFYHAYRLRTDGGTADIQQTDPHAR